MTEQKLFTDFDEPVKKEKPHFYSRYVLISYLIKVMRLGDTDLSLKVFWVCMAEGLSQWYIAKRLVQFASEDATGDRCYNYAVSTFLFIDKVKNDVNSIERCIIYLTKTPMMWDSADEHYWECRRYQIIDEIEACYKEHRKPLEIPEWVMDKHTSQGKAKLRRGEEVDERFSGVMRGSALFMRAASLRDGRVHPNISTKENCHTYHLNRCMEESMTVDQYLEKYKITAEDFLDPTITE